MSFFGHRTHLPPCVILLKKKSFTFGCLTFSVKCIVLLIYLVNLPLTLSKMGPNIFGIRIFNRVAFKNTFVWYHQPKFTLASCFLTYIWSLPQEKVTPFCESPPPPLEKFGRFVSLPHFFKIPFNSQPGSGEGVQFLTMWVSIYLFKVAKKPPKQCGKSVQS